MNLSQFGTLAARLEPEGVAGSALQYHTIPQEIRGFHPSLVFRAFCSISPTYGQ